MKAGFISLGCAKNLVDTEVMLGILQDNGIELTPDPAEAEIIIVNTCAFIQSAKEESITTVLNMAEYKETGCCRSLIIAGCLGERYHQELLDDMPEADAIIGTGAWNRIMEAVRETLAGNRIVLTGENEIVYDAKTPRILTTPAYTAYVKIAEGCDHRCAFCAIPAFRGSYLSRPVADIIAEARWLVEQGVKEVLLVSENTSSYGKDLPGVNLETLLPQLSRVDGLEWIRVSYLQPAEIRPGMLEVMLDTGKVVPYFDLSFQHAAPGVLRRMRRFGDPDSFLGLVERIRAVEPRAGIRSNVIAGFPGETESDVETLREFIIDANLDFLGVFGYSDEEGTEGEGLDAHLDQAEVDARRELLADVANMVCESRAAERVGERTVVLVEETGAGGASGRAPHQGPETDGVVELPGADARIGQFIEVELIDATGIDMVGEAR